MGKMIRPIIQGLASRPGNSQYKSNLLRKFTHRALSNTNLADTELENAVSNQLDQHKYGVALQTLKSQEVPVDTNTYFPKTFPESLPFVKEKSPQLTEAARGIFTQLTESIDQILQQRLITTSHLSTSLFCGKIKLTQLLAHSEG